MPSPLGRNPSVPKRGQGRGENPSPVPVHMQMPVTEEPDDGIIRVCIDKEIPEELLELNAQLAIAENIENIPLVPFGNASISPAQMAMLTGKKWQNGRVIKCFFMSRVVEGVRPRIIKWAKEWENYANLRFEFTEDQNASDIRIDADPEDGSWSFVGTDCLSVAKSEATMNYGWLKIDTPEDEVSRVVVHEFGHAIGCIHEHQHPEQGIPWNKDAVYGYYTKAPNNWTKAQVDGNLFRKYSATITQFSAWDASSIMSYSVPKSLTDGKFEIGWNKGLSDMDKKFVGQMYPKTNNEDVVGFIRRLFLMIFGRPASDTDVQTIGGQLANRGRAHVINGLERSAENGARLAKSFYNLCLERNPTTREVQEIVDELNRSITEEQIISRIVGSDEFYAKAGNLADKFIDRCYSVLLNRPPTDVDKQHWQLNISLYGRYHVALTIAGGRERRTKIIRQYYETYLKRSPSVAELNALVSSNIDIGQVRVVIESSQEFYNIKD